MKTAGYAVAHWAVDFCCALLLLGSFSKDYRWMEILLLYNFSAFALQLPFGILADRINRNHAVAAVGGALVALSFLLVNLPLLCAVLAGCGNALFHVGGGIEILNESKKSALKLGLFVAPGALGLFLGSQLSGIGFLFWLAPALLGAASLLLFLRASFSTQNAPLCAPSFSAGLLSLFGVVVLRSFLGFCMDFSWNNTLLTAVAVVVGTVLGKAAGGILMDRVGYLPASILSLGLATVLLLFPQNMVTGILGIFFFQMTMPLTLFAAAEHCKGAKGFAFGLLTFGLFLGFVPKLLGCTPPCSGLLLSLGALLSLGLLVLGRRESA